MVKLTYITTLFDLESSLVQQLLKQIWTFNTHSDKHTCVDCLMFEEWCISFARTKLEPDFVGFDLLIRKIKETDKTFINFDRISIFEPEKAYDILRNKYFFLAMGSIDLGYFLSMSPARLMIKIWVFPYHIYHFPAPDLSSCNCQNYLECCNDTAREMKRDNENYIYFDSVLYKFQFH